MKLSKALLSRRDEFKISRRSLATLKRAGVTSIGIGGPGYAVVWNSITKREEWLHRTLMFALGYKIEKLEIDHKNGNKLDNRIFNLRTATRLENCRNLSRRNDNNSGFKGVSRRTDTGRWRARIKNNLVEHALGTFDSAIEAAIAYNKAAKRIHGKFAKLNKIPK